jgi:hypothetical protein
LAATPLVRPPTPLIMHAICAFITIAKPSVMEIENIGLQARNDINFDDGLIFFEFKIGFISEM